MTGSTGRQTSGGAIETPSPSRASDIVELVILTTDEVFLRTLREAVGVSRRLWHLTSPDKVSDLLIAGGVGIAVFDTQALLQPASEFIAQIKRQFPDLVIVAAGSRQAESQLASLISEGTVYRFIHKPVSPGRALLFADAAVRRLAEQSLRKSSPAARPRAGARRIGAVAGLALACAVGAALWMSARREPNRSSPSSTAMPDSPQLVSKPAARAPSEVASRLPPPKDELRINRGGEAVGPRPRTDAGHPVTASPELAPRAASDLERGPTGATRTTTAGAAQNAAPAADLSADAAPAASALPDAGPAASVASAPPAGGLSDTSQAPAAAAAAAPGHDDASSAVIDAGRLVLERSVEPEYPTEARRAALEGWVELDFTLDTSGAARNISVHAASPRGVFERSAIHALAQWRYAPQRVGSVSVPQRARIRIRFALAR